MNDEQMRLRGKAAERAWKLDFDDAIFVSNKRLSTGMLCNVKLVGCVAMLIIIVSISTIGEETGISSC